MEEAGFIKTHLTLNSLYELKTKAAADLQSCKKWKGTSIIVGLLNLCEIFLCL